MLTNEEEKKICEEYSAVDNRGVKHCRECPLRRSNNQWDFQCKANSHYDAKLREWVYDKVN